MKIAALFTRALYPRNKDLTRLFEAFLNDSEFNMEALRNPVSYVAYEHIATSSLGTLVFWTSNKYYAYAMCGKFTAKDGTILKWDNEMPSRWVIARLEGIEQKEKEAEKFRWLKA